MATVRWRGDAAAVAQSDTFTVGTNDVTTTYAVTINGKKVSVLGQVGGANSTATALQVALAASIFPEFQEIAWTVLTNVVTGTANTAGKPFTATSSVSGGAGTMSHSTTVTSQGPHDASIASNWSTGNLPANADNVYFDQGSSDVLYGLDQHLVTPASITVLPGFTGNIGLPAVNSDNSANTYYEYRPTYLQFGNSGASTNIAVTINGGGGRIKFDQGTSQATYNVMAKAQRAETKVPQVLLKTTHASSALNVDKGDVAVAWFADELSTLLTLNVGFLSNVSSDSSVWLGAGVTLTNTTVVQSGGTLTYNSALTGTGFHTQYNGISDVGPQGGTFAFAGLLLLGGSCVYSTTGSLGGTVKVGNTGVLDFSQDLRGKTVSNPIEIFGSKCQVLDPNAVVNSGTLSVGFNEVADADQVNWGQNFRLVRGVTP